MSNNSNACLGDLLPFWHFDEDFMVFSNGALGCGFRIQGQDVSCSTPNQINEIGTNLSNLFNTAQENLKLQLFYRMNSDVSPQLAEHQKLSGKCDRLYVPISSQRIRYFEQKMLAGEYFSPEIFLFVKSAPLKYKNKKLFEVDSKFSQTTLNHYLKHRSQFQRSVTQIYSSLEAAGFEPKQLTQTQWFGLLCESLNRDRIEKFGIPTLRNTASLICQSLADQLVLSDVTLHKDHFQIESSLFRVITLKTLPEETHASLGNILLKLPFHCWISQNIELLDQKKEYDSLQLKRKFTHSMASGSGSVSDMESESKLGHIEGLLSEILESSEKILAADLNIILWADTKEQLEEKSDETLRTFKTLNQAEAIVETYPGLEAFIKTLPGNCEGLRKKKMKTSNVAHLMPVYDYWRGNKRSVCLLSNRDNVLVSVDPFDRSLPNWNGLVIGSSGSGKSFTLSQLVLMFYGQTPRPKIVWLDNGASSKNIVDCLDGQFVELNLDSKICLNPFDLGKGQNTPSPSKVKLILGVIENICKEDGTLGLPKVEKALLEEAIYRAYQSSKATPTLGKFRKILMEHPRSEIKKYGEILYSWTGNTAYGRLLDGQTNIRLEKNLVSFELRGLDVHEELQNVFLLVLTDYIQREASAEDRQNYLLIIDEAWKLLQSKSGASFTVEAYRTFRKFNAGIWAISQNINDFKAQEDIANAILQNTPSRIILKQRGVNWEDFKKVLALNDTDVELIRSLKQEKGKYSEFFFLQDDNKTILRLEPDLLSYLICTTDPRDKTLIAEARKKHPQLGHIEALQTLCS